MSRRKDPVVDDDMASERTLGGELRGLVENAEELLQALAGQSGEAAAKMRERVEATVQSARARLANFEEGARDLTDEAFTTTDRYVRGNPWAAVAIAAAVGVVVGAILTRRN